MNQSARNKIAIKTFGCQMNAYDSQVAAGFLKKAGYEISHSHEDDAPSETNPRTLKDLVKNPDIVLMNTCSIREHAEDRVFSRLGMLGKAKKTNPDLIIGLLGCMVEEHREKLFKRFPQLDLMVGTRNIKELPELIEQVRNTRHQVSKIKQDGISIEYSESINRQGLFHAWLPIMTGCNKVCTFCIVPITRGSEVSMPAREVYREASRLASEGVKWITLLGQNVNSYNPSFPKLLEMLCEIEGLEKISFTTSHPQDATEDLFKVIARNPKISRRFHLPLQSGSDRILKRMKRLHTYEEYKVKIDQMRSVIPDLCVTTDIITGFSGETEEDHQATVQALKEIRYDGGYIYKYSFRPGTPAAKLPDDIPLAMKEKRNAELIHIQNQITREINESYLGKTVEVFGESLGTRIQGQVIGRSHHEKRVIFNGDAAALGKFSSIEIQSLNRETLLGKLV